MGRNVPPEGKPPAEAWSVVAEAICFGIGWQVSRAPVHEVPPEGLPFGGTVAPGGAMWYTETS